MLNKYTFDNNKKYLALKEKRSGKFGYGKITVFHCRSNIIGQFDQSTRRIV